ncbi:hypothetical protein JOE11_003526 [Robbsia andropogonis]|uniref:hypothetical protein n=1 Tax=Robbsia andropogonis TaxID=28092 RepID=UPI003D22ECFE
MQIIPNAFSYASSRLLEPWFSVDDSATQASCDDVNHSAGTHLENIPGDIFKAGKLQLSTRSIVTLASTSKRLATFMESLFPQLFNALSEIRAVHTGWMPLLSSDVITSIQAHPCKTDQTALLRKLVMGIPASKIFLERALPDGLCIFSADLKSVIAAIEKEISKPTQSSQEAFSLLDILVIRFMSGSGVTRNSLTDSLDLFDKALLPAMIVSVNAEPLLQRLSYEISVYLCARHQVDVSDEVAGIIANNLFFDHNWTPVVWESSFLYKRSKGEFVRKRMESGLGLFTQSQWSAIDKRVASRIHLALPYRPGEKFDDLCQAWREDDAAFVIQAEEATIAAEPHYDFGDRVMVGVHLRSKWAVSATALDLWSGR